MALIEIDWNPPDRVLKQFAGIWLPAAAIVLGSLVFLKTNSLGLAALIWGVSFLVCLIGYLVPGFIRPIFVASLCAAYPIGWVVSHLMLLIMFYLVVTPIGLLLRAFGYDPMNRTWDKSAGTYWVEHSDSDTARYFRQF